MTVSATTGSGNAISREWWSNIDGSIVATIPLASPPSGTGSLPSFEAPSNWGENYGQRVRGFLVAPTTGAYVFWIASDNNSELWLSSDASASKRSKIASVSGWAPPRSWLVMPSQKSAPVNLVAGTTYYIEALHKEGGGGDSLAVGWSRPGQSTATASEVIPGSVLRPWKANAAPTVSAGGDVGTVLGGSARLSGAATDDGQPTGSTLATTWTLVRGPGTVTWADASLAATTATFSAIGSYTLRLTASDGERSSSDDVVVTVETPGITRDYWLGLSDTTSVAGIPRLTASSGSEILSSYEAPTNWASNYGQIVRGQLVAPVSGSYTFWIAGDNNCELWLSTSSDPAARVRIASVTGWTLPRQWGKYTSQRSVAITLSAGSRYYIEALHIESGGGDCLGVGWSKPGEATSTASEIIPGAVLRPYVPSGGG